MNNKAYGIAWYMIDNPDANGRGQAVFTANEASRIAKQLNHELKKDRIHHYIFRNEAPESEMEAT